MSYEQCSICGRLYNNSSAMARLGFKHLCPPIWHVHWDAIHSWDDMNEYKEVRADTAEEAAEVFLNKENQGSGCDFVERAIVSVRRFDSDKWEQFQITAEYTVSYSATKHATKKHKKGG